MRKLAIITFWIVCTLRCIILTSLSWNPYNKDIQEKCLLFLNITDFEEAGCQQLVHIFSYALSSFNEDEKGQLYNLFSANLC